MAVGIDDSQEGRVPLRFAGALEREFQARHYANVQATLRLSSLLLATLAVLYGVRDFLDTGSALFAVRTVGPTILFYLLVLGLTFTESFGRFWQPVVVLGGWVAATGTLYTFGALLSGALPGGGTPATPPSYDAHQFSDIFFALQTCLLMACLATFRLTFIWALSLQAGVVGIGAWQIVTRDHNDTGHDLSRFLQSALLVLFAVLLAAYVQEGMARGAFFANYQLDLERNDERRMREKTEGMLGVLSQAIGGIVHDLGNPLTTVQLGASTLNHVIDNAGDNLDMSLVKTFAGHIESGAEMLNFLRLSLIEQTRVLDGKSTPVRLAPIALRPLVEAGIRYQKPRFAHARKVEISGDDVQVLADEMKMTTIFMNLIGNAFKYTDGPIRVVWFPSGPSLQIVVLDRGLAGRGITRHQASLLFAPFGRLSSHATIEGTGLGLLSVRNIIEAHGGRVHIEGFVDGTPASAIFSTADGDDPPVCAPLLTDRYRTAFVFTCSYVH